MAEHAQNTKRVLPLSNKSYDNLHYIVQYWFPGAGALYFALAQLWGFPAAEQVVGTIAALTVFLGILLGISKRSYTHSDAPYDGEMVVDTDEDGQDVYRVDVPQYLLGDKEAVFLKVTPGPDVAIPPTLPPEVPSQ